MDRMITKRTVLRDGYIRIEGVLGDALPDQSGMTTDLAWLYEAACKWLGSGLVWAPGLRGQPVGKPEAVWTAGPVVYLRCRVTPGAQWLLEPERKLCYDLAIRDPRPEWTGGIHLADGRLAGVGILEVPQEKIEKQVDRV